MEHPLCGGGHGDPLAKKPRASAAPLAMVLPDASRGSQSKKREVNASSADVQGISKPSVPFPPSA